MVQLTVSVLLLVAGVVAMLVLHVLIVVWALRRGVVLRAAASRRQDEERAGAAGGLSAEDLDELPCHDHECGKAGAGAGAGAECAVCLEAFQAGDRCRVLPRCEHGFHAQCIDQWLRKSRLCPVCRAEVGGGGGGTGRGKAVGALAGTSSSAVVAERQGGADR